MFYRVCLLNKVWNTLYMKKIIVLFISLLVLSIVVSIIMIPGYIDQSIHQNPMPVLGNVPDFSLINSSTDEVTSSPSER